MILQREKNSFIKLQLTTATDYFNSIVQQESFLLLLKFLTIVCMYKQLSQTSHLTLNIFPEKFQVSLSNNKL